jgi:hypothetical protein
MGVAVGMAEAIDRTGGTTISGGAHDLDDTVLRLASYREARARRVYGQASPTRMPSTRRQG